MERKIAAGGGIGISVSVILIWVFETMMPEVVVPSEQATAFGAICTVLAGYLVPNKK